MNENQEEKKVIHLAAYRKIDEKISLTLKLIRLKIRKLKGISQSGYIVKFGNQASSNTEEKLGEFLRAPKTTIDAEINSLVDLKDKLKLEQKKTKAKIEMLEVYEIKRQLENEEWVKATTETEITTFSLLDLTKKHKFFTFRPRESKEDNQPDL